MAIPLSVLVNLPVAGKWKQLEVQLGVPTETLDEIQANNKNSPDFSQECLRGMFVWWLNINSDATYERLAHGIKDIKTIISVTEFLQQRSDGDHGEVYSKLEHAVNSIRERDFAGRDGGSEYFNTLHSVFVMMWFSPQIELG